MKKLFTITLLLLLTGCSHRLRMEHSGLDLKIELDKSQYEIVGNVEGEASTSWFLLFYIPIALESSPTYGAIEYPGIFVRNVTEQNAIYNAIINSGEDIDYIVAPHFETLVTGFPPFYWKTTVKVSGKGIRLKEG